MHYESMIIIELFHNFVLPSPDVLPNESVAAILTRLSTVKLSNNKISEKEPFYVPRFILELPKYDFMAV